MELGKINQLTDCSSSDHDCWLVKKQIKKELIKKFGKRKRETFKNGFPKDMLDWEAHGYNACYDRFMKIVEEL